MLRGGICLRRATGNRCWLWEASARAWLQCKKGSGSKSKGVVKSPGQGRLGGSVGRASDLGSGHDLGASRVPGSEPGAADSVSASLSAPPLLALSLHLSKVNKH